MKVTSKIKTMFSNELLRYIAAICDTERIPSNNKKMIVLCKLLNKYGIDYEILGGATNRIALQIEGYAVKFAMDEMGYIDNLMEYSLSSELQPYVTKSYETNGYVQIQETVEVMTKELWKVYRNEISKVLDILCIDYLLGDVGLIDRNRTNWGMRDGKPVVLDYAYCHRATEKLFVCEKCGAPLNYNSTYDKLMCSDRSSCLAIYNYNERKQAQGVQVDLDMIKDVKKYSIRIAGEDVSMEIEQIDDRLFSNDKFFIVNEPNDLIRYEELKEERRRMKLEMNGETEQEYMERCFAALVDLANNPEDSKARAIIDATYDPIELIYTDAYVEKYMCDDYEEVDTTPDEGYFDDLGEWHAPEISERQIEENIAQMELDLGNLIDLVRERHGFNNNNDNTYKDSHQSQLDDYLSKRNPQPDIEPEVVQEDIDKQEDINEPETINTDYDYSYGTEDTHERIDETVIINDDSGVEQEPEELDSRYERLINYETGEVIPNVVIDNGLDMQFTDVVDEETGEHHVVITGKDVSRAEEILLQGKHDHIPDEWVKTYHNGMFEDIELPFINKDAAKIIEKHKAKKSNPEDSAVLVNGKPLPIGEEMTI